MSQFYVKIQCQCQINLESQCQTNLSDHTGVRNLPSFNPVQIAKLEKSSQTEFAQPRFEAYPPKPNLQPAKPQPFVLVKITLASGTTLEFSTPDPEGFALRLAGVAG